MGETVKETNCPFYGRHMYMPHPMSKGAHPFLLLDQRGNQCAVRTDAYAPCWMEASQMAVNWKECPLVKELRVGTEVHD